MRKLLALLLFAFTSHASVTISVSVAGVTSTPPPAGAYIEFDLVNCVNPTILGTPSPVSASQQFPLNRQYSITVTIPDNVSQIACNGNQLSYYTVTYYANGVGTVLKSVELPAGNFNLANLANLTVPPFNPGVIQGPTGPQGAASTVPGPQGPAGTTTATGTSGSFTVPGVLTSGSSITGSLTLSSIAFTSSFTQCPTSPNQEFLTGYTVNLAPICEVPPYPGAVTTYYQTVQSSGTQQTQQAYLNFLSPFIAVNNAGNTSTDVTLAPSGVTAGTYTSANITVAANGLITSATNGGSVTGSINDVSGSRTCGTIYQNTSGLAMYVVVSSQVAGFSGATLTATGGPSSPPSITLGQVSIVAAGSSSATGSITFIIPNLNFYSVTRDIGCGISHWVETTIP